MPILTTLLLLALRQSYWPTASPDNGYSQYLAAGQMVQTPYWKKVNLYVSPEKKPLAVLRGEAAHAGPILAALRKGNAMPVYDPIKQETLLTLHPEYSPFRQVERIALDVAYVKAKDGDLESASQWLIQADQFAFRLPAPLFITLLVKQVMLAQLRARTQKLLPLFGARQLKEQLQELQLIATHPANVQAALASSSQAVDRSIPIVVADPSTLGVRSDPPDISDALGKIASMPEMTPEFQAVLQKIMAAAPKEAQEEPEAGLKYLAGAQDQVPAQYLAAYKKFVDALMAAVKPGIYDISAFAKGLDAPSKDHAQQVVALFLQPERDSVASAFQRPEKSWWQGWIVKRETGLNDQMMKDGKDGQFTKVDMYALQVAQPLGALASGANDDPTSYCRSILLQREQARLAVIDAEIWSYKAANHRLPTSLKSFGNPVDPLSDKPYLYRRISPTRYELAALGIPGIAKIDANTRTTPSKS